jgi:hypothetical protein
VLVLPSLTKYLAGGTAMMGVMDEMRRAGQVSVELLNASAGFLISPFDLPGGGRADLGRPAGRRGLETGGPGCLRRHRLAHRWPCCTRLTARRGGAA